MLPRLCQLTRVAAPVSCSAQNELLVSVWCVMTHGLMSSCAHSSTSPTGGPLSQTRPHPALGPSANQQQKRQHCAQQQYTHKHMLEGRSRTCNDTACRTLHASVSHVPNVCNRHNVRRVQPARCSLHGDRMAGICNHQPWNIGPLACVCNSLQVMQYHALGEALGAAGATGYRRHMQRMPYLLAHNCMPATPPTCTQLTQP